MRTAPRSMSRSAQPVPAGLPRLLRQGSPGESVSLGQHLASWGGLPLKGAGQHLLAELEASGLRGHGGGWFPVAAKWRAVLAARGRAPVVIANGAEGEPASAKDAVLLQHFPHLVLDGASLASVTLGAKRSVVFVSSHLADPIRAAVEERWTTGHDPVSFEVVVAPDRFLAGQESAAVRIVEGASEARPRFVGLRPVYERGVRGRPTLVQNVETLAHVALIARFGAAWFRSLGIGGSPGSALLTVSWPSGQREVLEAPLGVTLREVLGASSSQARDIQGVLLGGYGGGFLTTEEALSLTLTEEAARQAGTSLGAGVVALMPAEVCPLEEVARVTRFMAAESAGQCGPCLYGLAELAQDITTLATRPGAFRGSVASLLETCALVVGRGACKHPDGVARSLASALSVFAAHVEVHLRRRPCQRLGAPPFLPVGPGPGERRTR